MKNIFYLLLTTLLFVFVANSPTFGMEADYDPVKVENVIYCDCVAYVHELPTAEIQKEFATVKPLELRQNENFGIFFQDGICLSRDNTETQRTFYKVLNLHQTIFENFATVISSSINWYSR